MLNVIRSFAGGPRTRRPVDGPEQAVVASILQKIESHFGPPRGCAQTVFLEPALESGFPDVVLVTWHRKTAESIASLIEGLDTDCLRLLHLLATTKATDPLLESLFGPKRLSRLLDVLLDLRLIYRRSSGWRTKPVSQLCAVRQIVAFEAKVDDVSGVLRQASANRWFASSSFVVLASRRPAERALPRASALGLGVWVGSEDQPLSLPQTTGSQPLSYASWLFGLWSIRQSQASIQGLPMEA